MEFLEINENGTSVEMVLMNLVNKSEFWFGNAQLENKLLQRQPNMVTRQFWPQQLLVYNEIVIIKYDLLIDMPPAENLANLQFIFKI